MLRKGRFGESADSDIFEYTASLKEDLRLFDAVVQINMAHLKILKEQEIIKKEKSEKIRETLSNLRKKGTEALDLRPEIEDIHMAIEEYVNEKLGEAIGGEMHTAKSRNDQVATAIRMVLREEILSLQKETINFVEKLTEKAEKNTETVMPGYTHLQVAEPTTFAHYLLSYAESFLRDKKRLDNAYSQTNKCPLGACAFAGTSFSIDREKTSSLLGFQEILENTMDATSTRDFALKTMSDLSVLATTLSRMSEEIILWNSAEFDMIQIPDEFSSTSSIMPQKKNPEVAELGRAKSGIITGNLIGALNIMKSVPQAYNLDLQELTPLLWESMEEAKSTVKAMNKLFENLKPKKEKMEENLNQGFPTATELANTLARKEKIPFRKAHQIVGRLSAQMDEKNIETEELTLDDLNSAYEKIIGEKTEISKEEFKNALDPSKSIEKKDVSGGPSQKAVRKEIGKIREKIKAEKRVLDERSESLKKARNNLIE